MNKNFIIFLATLLIYPLPSFAHDIMGKVGFYDGLSHPVLGLDHLLAMISVGIISAQIGGRAIWSVPCIFVILMTIGSLFGFLLIIEEFYFVEIGIVFSVILLGITITIENKNPNNINNDFCSNFWFISWDCSWFRSASSSKPYFIYFRFQHRNSYFTFIRSRNWSFIY